MSFANVIGQDKAVRLLQSQLRNQQLSHAYLFSGLAGTGKKKLAWALAKALFCVNKQDEACGTCVQCKKIEHGNHPFIYVLEPDGQSIKINQIRVLQDRFSYKSDETKMAIIYQADRMTVEAANSLLKTLEEPLSNCVMILITENDQTILPTIRSRVQMVRLQPLPLQKREDELIRQGCKREIARAVVRLTSGMDTALDLARQEWFAQIRQLVIQLAKASQQRSSESLLLFQKHWSKLQLSEHLDCLLDLFVLWFRDMVQLKSGVEDRLVFADQQDWLKQHAHKQSSFFWVTCMEHAVEAKKRLRYNVNPQLTLEQFLIRIQGE